MRLASNWSLYASEIGFNPRTPCGVRRRFSVRLAVKIQFQSTHSLRSATRQFAGKNVSIKVSIHALLAECDLTYPPHVSRYGMFQSTHSLRSATGQTGKKAARHRVSIHALLAECDFTILIQEIDARVSIHALLAECDTIQLNLLI